MAPPCPGLAPIVLAERITDGLAMFVLAGLGLFFFRSQGPTLWVLVAVAGGMMGFVLLTRWRALVMRGLGVWGRLPLVGRFQVQMIAAYDSTYDIFAIPRLLFAVGLGVISWGGECLALYLTLIGARRGARVRCDAGISLYPGRIHADWRR